MAEVGPFNSPLPGWKLHLVIVSGCKSERNIGWGNWLSTAIRQGQQLALHSPRQNNVAPSADRQHLHSLSVALNLQYGVQDYADKHLNSKFGTTEEVAALHCIPACPSKQKVQQNNKKHPREICQISKLANIWDFALPPRSGTYGPGGRMNGSAWENRERERGKRKDECLHLCVDFPSGKSRELWADIIQHRLSLSVFWPCASRLSCESVFAKRWDGQRYRICATDREHMALYTCLLM